MWKAYMKLDERVISLVQESYLWLLDRTGVYVATVAFALYVASVGGQVITGSAWLTIFLIGITGLFLIHKYLLQDKGKNDLFNAIALQMANMRVRHAFNVLFIMILIPTDLLVREYCRLP